MFAKTKEERKNAGVTHDVYYVHGSGKMTLRIFDKNGGVRSRLELDDYMLKDLKEAIEECLNGEEG